MSPCTAKLSAYRSQAFGKYVFLIYREICIRKKERKKEEKANE